MANQGGLSHAKEVCSSADGCRAGGFERSAQEATGFRSEGASRPRSASIFMFCEPLAGWRQVSVRERRTKVDWAEEVETLLRTRYASVKKVILVSDNLNTHTKGAFYEAFEPAMARALVQRLEFCHTPKHGSWLNIAENELSSMTRQCVTGRRFATVEELGD